MHGTYEQNKKSMIRWTTKNKDKVKIINLKAGRKRCEWLKIQKVFLKILL
jgi:hypothetical protein